MKSEKQILNVSLSMGTEFIEDYSDGKYTVIKVPYQKGKRWFFKTVEKKVSTDVYKKCLLPYNSPWGDEFVIEAADESGDLYYFKFNYQDNKEIINSYKLSDGKCYWSGELTIVLDTMIDYETPETVVYLRQNYRKEQIFELSENTKIYLVSTHLWSKSFLFDLQTEMDNRPTLFIQTKDVVQHNTGLNQPSRGSITKAKEINLTGVRIIYSKGTSMTKTRTIVRHVETWSVRGHSRHYKSGKTVFIKPYIKGNKSGKPQSKTYIY